MHHQFAGADHGAVSSGQTDRFATGLVDQSDDVLLHFAAQNPLHHFHGFGIGHAHAFDELAFFAQTLQEALNLGASAVNDHRVHAHELEQHHIFGKRFLQSGVGHGVTAVFDDQGFAVELTDVRQCLREDFCRVERAHGGPVGLKLISILVYVLSGYRWCWLHIGKWP